MEVITKDTEEVRAYFEALEEGMRYIDTVTAHFRPAMNGEVYFTGEDVCRMLHITSRTLQGYRTQRLIPYISLPGKTLYRQSDLLRMLEENYVDMRQKRKRGLPKPERRKAMRCRPLNIRHGNGVPAFAVFRMEKGVKPFPGGTGAPVSCLASCPFSPVRSAAWRRGCQRLPGNLNLPSCWLLQRRSAWC